MITRRASSARHRYPRKVWSWLSENHLTAVFCILFGAGGLILLLSLFWRSLWGLSRTDLVTLFVGLVAAGVVWWQGHLIKQQMQLDAVLDLDREWNSKQMLENRSAAWNDKNEPELDTIEGVLEFLEKVSTFARRRIVSADFIWDTFGWYVWRYYFYSRKAIRKRRAYHTDTFDPTLYADLQRLCTTLIEKEIEARNKAKGKGQKRIDIRDVVRELEQHKAEFAKAERQDDD